MEHYDEKITNIDFGKCMNKCKYITDCHGISYVNNKCYLSRVPILEKNSDQLYNDEYNENNPRCNKMSISYVPVYSFDEMRGNATFICSDKEYGDTSVYLHNHNKVNKMKDYNEVYNTMDIDKYETESYNWPKEKPKPKPKPKSEILSETKLLNDSKQNEKDNTFNPICHENIGNYLNEYQCQYDLSFDTCINSCINNDKCIAFEYNPELIRYSNITLEHEKYNNICCLKSSLGQYIKRRKENENGKLYVKSKYILV